MRIWVKPDLLAKLGLTVPDLTRAVQQQSTVNPAGQIGAEPAPKGKEMTYTLRAQGRLQTPEEFGAVVRLNPDASVVRLKDVARIELGAQKLSADRPLQRSARRHHRCLSGARAKRAGGSRWCQENHGGSEQRFPPILITLIGLDTTRSVTREGISEIGLTLLIAIALVISGGLYLLQNLEGDADPDVIAVPVSLIGKFSSQSFRCWVDQYAVALCAGAGNRFGR
jgi:HAE1 family hydrophobic/amphiphilic exporter-1